MRMGNFSVDRELRRAKLKERDGALDDAKKIYASLLEKFPNNPRAKKGLAALEGIRHGAVEAKSPDKAVQEIVLLLQQRQFSQAADKAQELVVAFPEAFELWAILGTANERAGRLDRAELGYREAARLKPDNPEIHGLLGNVLRNRGKLDAAIESFRKALELKPASFDALNDLGIALGLRGVPDESIEAFRQALRIRPDAAGTLINLGVVLREEGRIDEAIDAYEQALQIQPNSIEALTNLGVAFMGRGLLDDAVERFRKALQIKPDTLEGLNNLGVALKDQARFAEAIDALRKALAIKPNSVETLINLGMAFEANGRAREAIDAYEQAVRIMPESAAAQTGLGNALRADGRLEEAILAYRRALNIEKNSVEAHINLGVALRNWGRPDEAVAAYRRALEIKPDSVDALIALGGALKTEGKLDQAIESFERALEIQRDATKALAAKLRLQLEMSDWAGLPEFAAVSGELGIKGDATNPFAMLPFEDNPAHQAERSKNYARQKFKEEALPFPTRNRQGSDKIRVGYFSADFHDHATLFLMSGMLREHDKARFEIFIYSYGEAHPSKLRDQLVCDVDHFFDIHGFSDEAIVEMAREHELDIAIDVKGYTKDSRSGLFAYRLAPVQINFLAYPGTMGADFIDYIVADRVLIPDSERQFYTEQILYLPNSYMPADDKRQIANAPTSRSDFGLPENAFVFCCFNQSYKIGPREFDIWMRVLRNVEGSVLWLFHSNEWAEANLRREAQSRGVSPDRLVFADRLALEEHLARHKHADLFVDTFNYNAHTTAVDALWAGLPVATKAGRQFAARVGASLLTAVGLPELITETEEAYEALILDIATNPERLAAIKAKLAENRRTHSLFDTVRYTRDFEQALETAHDRYCRAGG